MDGWIGGCMECYIVVFNSAKGLNPVPSTRQPSASTSPHCNDKLFNDFALLIGILVHCSSCSVVVFVFSEPYFFALFAIRVCEAYEAILGAGYSQLSKRWGLLALL